MVARQAFLMRIAIEALKTLTRLQATQRCESCVDGVVGDVLGEGLDAAGDAVVVRLLKIGCRNSDLRDLLA